MKSAAQALVAAQAEPDQPAAVFRALDRALASEPGHILFTVLLHHKAERQNERFYTNMPEAYPIGGRKPITNSPWMRRVIHGGQPYIGRTREDIREVLLRLRADLVARLQVHAQHARALGRRDAGHA